MPCLEVCVGQNVGGGVKVLDLLEGRHDLLPDHAAALVHQLYGRPLPVVRHAVTHHHVELVLVVLDQSEVSIESVVQSEVSIETR